MGVPPAHQQAVAPDDQAASLRRLNVDRFAQHGDFDPQCGELVELHRRESWIGTGRRDCDLPDGFAERPVAADVADAAAQVVSFPLLERHEGSAAQRRAGNIGRLGR